MKKFILYTLAIFCAFLPACNGQAKYEMFPSKAEILNDQYLLFDNFFPIATVDLTSKGIKDTIPIMYISFDPDIVDSLCFPKNDNQDGFTFGMDNTGKLLPLFNENAFKIGARFEQFFILGQEKYKQALIRPSELKKKILFPKKPNWWQNDETPLNSSGQKYEFICELEIDEFFSDDCKLYVFFDEKDRKVKYVYQRF